MAKLSLDDRLNQIEDKISEKSFRENKGLGNEVGCARIPAYFLGFFLLFCSNIIYPLFIICKTTEPCHLTVSSSLFGAAYPPYSTI